MDQNVTPDTVAYLYLGLGVIATVMIVLVGNMVVKYQNLKRDARLLADLERDDQR